MKKAGFLAIVVLLAAGFRATAPGGKGPTKDEQEI